MLRYLVLVLVLVNLAFWAWAQGWLDGMVGAGVRADGQHEPHRLQQQAHVDMVVMLPAQVMPGAATAPSPSAPAGAGASVPATTEAPASTPSSTPAVAPPPAEASTAASAMVRTVCIEAGPFQAGEFTGVEAALKKALKPGTWQTQSVSVPGLWLVYMGP